MTKVVLVAHGLHLVGTLRRAPVHLTAWQALRRQHELRLARAKEIVADARNTRNVTVLRAALRQRCARTGGAR